MKIITGQSESRTEFSNGQTYGLIGAVVAGFVGGG